MYHLRCSAGFAPFEFFLANKHNFDVHISLPLLSFHGLTVMSSVAVVFFFHAEPANILVFEVELFRNQKLAVRGKKI